MTAPSKIPKKISLQIHIIILSAVLIIASGASLAWYGYSLNSKNMINAGKKLLHKSSSEVIKKIHSEADHVHTMLKILNASNITKISTKQEKIKTLPVLSEMLKATSSLSAIFVAYPDNDFFLYRELTSNLKQEQYNAPKSSYFMMTLRQYNITHHYFYSISGKLLEVVEDPEYNLQINERPWYTPAITSNTFAITDAYLFHASQEFGVTMVEQDPLDKSIIGADYTLGTLSKLLKEFPAYQSSQRIVVNKKGQVIAYQNTEQLLSNQGKFDELKSISDLNQPALTYVSENYENHQGSILFSFNDETWLGEVSPLSEKNDLKLLQIVKTKDLLADAYEIRDRSILITLFIILATLPIAWYFARLLTAPLSGLTTELERIKNFDFSQKIMTQTGIREIAEIISVTNNMKETISYFLDLSASLISKQSSQQLLYKISEECNKIPNSQGTIIMINTKQQCRIKHCNFPTLNTEENTILNQQLSKLMLSYDQLLANQPENTIPDEIYKIIKVSFNDNIKLNWRLIPMKNRTDDNLGLIAVLESQQTPLNDGTLQYAQAIASFSALSIHSQLLLAEQKQLLESFILLIAGAIDSQSPYTGGHCARVPELTKMLTRAACDDQQGAYKNFNLSEDQWEELHIAAWLHDCGKIVTPEYIVDKATKLETVYDRLNEVRMRFELLKVEADKCFWQGLANNGDKEILSRQRDKLLKKLDEEFEFVAECNIGGEFMSDDKIKQLNEIANRTWTRTLNNKIGIAPHQALKIPETSLPTQENLLSDKIEHLIEREHIELTEPGNKWGFNMETPHYRFNRGELYNLSVKRGTLTDEDRFVINGHMVHTIAMLSKLPFPEHLKNIPTIAGGHHEKMDGTGYPRKIKATELPVTARMMVIADIFEALTASDRPYKERKTLSQSIKIMSFMVKDDHIDPEVFELFLTSGVYLQYANEYLLEDQIDEVNISDYL